MKKFFNKIVVSVLALSMLIPAHSLTAHAEIVEYLDPYKPQDIRTGFYEFEKHDTEWEATVHPYIDNLNKARAEAIAQVQTNELLAEQDRTGYPFVKIPARDFLCNYDTFGYLTLDDAIYFDAESYAAMYPEVKEQYGNKFTDLWNHYKTIGVYEGKVAHTSEGFACGYDAIMALYEVWTPEMTDREKVIFVDNYLRQICFPTEQRPGIYSVDPTDGQQSTYAVVYAYMFNEIMRQLGIPCIIENSYEITDPHDDIWDSDWNQVYIDGQWYVVDTYMNDFTNSDQYLLIDRHPLAYPDYWAEKNIEVYSTTTLKPTYTEEDIQTGEMTAFWGPKEDMQMFLDQDFGDALIEDWENTVNEVHSATY